MSQANPHHGQHGGDSYFVVDQIYLLGLSLAFGSISLALFFWRTEMLRRLFGPQFRFFILGSGIALVILAMTRTAFLWNRAGKSAAHGHRQGHGWAPWRCMVLTPPLILTFLLFLGFLPMDFKLAATPVVKDMSKEIQNQAQVYATLLALGPSAFGQLPLLPTASRRIQVGPPIPRSFLGLVRSADDAQSRAEWAGIMIAVKGQFFPQIWNKHTFLLGRPWVDDHHLDFVEIDTPIVISEEVVDHVKPNDWILVTGEVSYYQNKDTGGFYIMLRINGKKDVVKTTPEKGPFTR